VDLAPDLNTMVKDSVVAALQSPHVVKLLTEALVESVTQAVVKKLEETLQINSAAIQRMENELKKKEEKIEELKQEMRKRSDDLEQYQRRNNLRIFGVPENKKENADAVVIKGIKVIKEIVGRRAIISWTSLMLKKKTQ